MPVIGNFFKKTSSSTGPKNVSAGKRSASGVIFTLPRLLGSTSVFSLVGSSDSNLSIVNGNQISAATGIASGTTQRAVVRETLDYRALEYSVLFEGSASVPTISWDTSTAQGSSFTDTTVRKALASSPARGRATKGVTAGQKAYWEVRYTPSIPEDYSGNSGNGWIRSGGALSSYPTTLPNGYLGGGDNWSTLPTGLITVGNNMNNWNRQSTPFNSSAVICYCVDLDANLFYQRVNDGPWTAEITLPPHDGTIFPAYEIEANASAGASITGLFSSQDQVYPPRAGFTPLADLIPPPAIASNITAPVVAQVSAAGSAPFAWTSTVDATVYAGDVWHVQTSADGLKNADGSYKNPIQDLTKLIGPSEFVAGYVANWSATANPPPSSPFLTPTGKFYFQERVERYLEDGTLASPWSNEIVETVTGATTLLHAVAGHDRSKYLLIENGRTVTLSRLDVAAYARAIKAPRTAKSQFEVVVTSIDSGGGTLIFVDDGSNQLGPDASFNRPGGSGLSGISLLVREGGETDIRWSNYTQEIVETGADGDIISVTIDTGVSSSLVTFYRTRVDANSGQPVTVQLGSSRTIPFTTVYAGCGLLNHSGSATINFGQTPMARPLSQGYEIYG